MEKLNNTGEARSDSRGETGWEGVAAEAGKIDWAEMRVTQRAIEAQQDFEAKRAQLGEMRDKIADLAKPSGRFTDGGNLDAKEISYDTAGLEQKADTLRTEAAEARKQYKKLSTEEGRKAEAERLRKEAEEYDKFFARGLLVVGTGKLEEFEDKIQAAGDPEAKKQLEAARDEYIKNTVIPAGKGSVETVKNGDTGGDEDLKVEDRPDNEDSLKEEVAGRKAPTDRDRAQAFAEKINERSLAQNIIREKHALNSILRRMEKYDSNQGKLSFFEQRQYKKDFQELLRYGYSPDGNNSSSFNSIKKLIQGDVAADAKEMGRKKAENWKLVDMAAKGEFGKEFRKELKRKGFSKLPESWDDENYTSDEVSRMAFIAKSDYWR